jgi:outer membrane protein TolC
MKLLAGTLALFLCGLTLVGCQQVCYVQEPDLFEANLRLRMQPDPENDPSAGMRPLLSAMGAPATVIDPDRKPRYISLQETFAIALENGTIGTGSVRFPGSPLDDLVAFTGNGVAGSDRIRVFALAPAVNAAILEGSLARFDPQWVSSMNWIVNDNPVQGLNSFTNGEQANLSTSLVKPLPTGGTAGITFSANYLDLRTPPSGFFFLNPSYTTNLQLGFEQPLLRFNGVGINQLLPSAPFSNLFSQINSRPALSSTEGILITRIRFDQQRADFERRINYLLLNVEVAYWNLYGAYVTLFSADQALRQAHESWRVLKEQYDVGKADPVQFAQVRYQYESFRINRLTALDTVLENERALRVFLGMKMEDGERLVPADAPTMAPYLPNWQAAFEDALSLRPELVMAREDIKAKQLALVAVKTLLQPDLRLSATYALAGLGSRLDGGGAIQPGSPISFNSLNTLASGNFVNWNVGLNMIVPIGFRNELAQVRAARLALAQSFEVLKDQENKAHNILCRQYREVIANYKIIEARRLYRQTLAKELRDLTTKVEAGLLLPTDRTYGDSLLDAQRLWAAALSDEYGAVVAYNNALVQFEFSKGTIQHHDRIQIAEGQMPKGAQIRASEHERQRTRALVVAERTNPLILRPSSRLLPAACWPEGVAPPLPALWQDGPPLNKNEPAAADVPGVPGTVPQGFEVPLPPDRPAQTTQIPEGTRSIVAKMPPGVEMRVVPGRDQAIPSSPRLGIPGPLRELPTAPPSPAVFQGNEPPHLGEPVEP